MEIEALFLLTEPELVLEILEPVKMIIIILIDLELLQLETLETLILQQWTDLLQ